MSTVYKKLTAQDIAVVPFNAHKQYNFTSASAASNKVTYYHSRWTSESLDIYSSASSTVYGLPIDDINTIKYNQLDHLYYRNFKRDISNRFGNNHYINQKRELYGQANILSIPAGLYGFEIKPGSFFLSSSDDHKIIDDTYGNLYISGTNLKNYETDIRTNILNIGPVKGFKKYDLNTYNDAFAGHLSYDGYSPSKVYRRGETRVHKRLSYQTNHFGDEFDDSYHFNLLRYKNVNFSEKILFVGDFPAIDFNGASSELRLGHDQKYNFNKGDNFTITMWANVASGTHFTSSYLMSKSTTRTIIGTPREGGAGILSINETGSSQPKDVPSKAQFPFEVYVEDISSKPHVFFRKSDGRNITTISSSFSTGSTFHLTCRVSQSSMKMYIDGVASGGQGGSATDQSVFQNQNKANIYIGNKGGTSEFFSGSLSQINIYDKALSDTQILSHYSSSNGSPYVGNVFYQNGLATITHPNYQIVFGGIGNFIVGSESEGGDFIVGIEPLNNLKFQGSHLIYENEYQCTIDEHEFNATQNISARKIRSSDSEELADIATGSLFKHYVTTIGLYNEHNDLLVVGKLGQPTRISDETDTTFILRWDT